MKSLLEAARSEVASIGAAVRKREPRILLVLLIQALLVFTFGLVVYSQVSDSFTVS